MDKVKVKDKLDGEEDEVVRLVPVRTYLPKTEVDFAGASYFAGSEDEFILVPTKSGDILFWDQDSGVSSTYLDAPKRGLTFSSASSSRFA